MIKKTLHNPTNSDIVDYRISEAEFNSNGDIVIDQMSGNYKETGNTLEWTLRSGETLEFPAYVADYLKKIYDFLEVINEPVKTETKESEPEIKTDKISCKYCGQNFKNTRGLALHMAGKHAKELL